MHSSLVRLSSALESRKRLRGKQVNLESHQNSATFFRSAFDEFYYIKKRLISQAVMLIIHHETLSASFAPFINNSLLQYYNIFKLFLVKVYQFSIRRLVSFWCKVCVFKHWRISDRNGSKIIIKKKTNILRFQRDFYDIERHSIIFRNLNKSLSFFFIFPMNFILYFFYLYFRLQWIFLNSAPKQQIYLDYSSKSKKRRKEDNTHASLTWVLRHPYLLAPQWIISSSTHSAGCVKHPLN